MSDIDNVLGEPIAMGEDEVPITMITIGLSAELLEKIETYQHSKRIRSRVGAIREMLVNAFDEWAKKTEREIDTP